MPNVLSSVTGAPMSGAGVLIFTREGNRLFAHDLQTGREWMISEAMRDFDWTKDGQRVVMVDPKESGPTGRIFVVNRDGSEMRQLTTGPDDARPRWSPDGTQIVFQRKTRPDASFKTVGAEVWVMDANGANPRQLANGFDPEWSPEGKRIAFATNPAQSSGEKILRQNGIGLMNAAGANQWLPVSTQTSSKKFTPMEWSLSQARILDQPCWSPDGTEITFRALDGNGAYLATDATKGGVKQFLALYFDDTPRDFSYSPSGAYVTLGSGGLSGFETVNIFKTGSTDENGYIANGALATLGHIPKTTGEQAVNVDGFAWSPDSRAVVYAASVADSSGKLFAQGVHVFNLATGEDKLVIEAGRAPVFWIR